MRLLAPPLAPCLPSACVARSPAAPAGLLPTPATTPALLPLPSSPCRRRRRSIPRATTRLCASPPLGLRQPAGTPCTSMELGARAAASPARALHPPMVVRPGSLPRRFFKVVSYYSLTTPPYKLDALEPYMSKRTLELHWGKHHQDYVDGLNRQLATSPMYGHTLEELVKEAYNNGNPLPEHNDAAQVWNHHFFWESMQPDGGGSPEGGVLQQIEKDFGSFTNFREEFIRSALSLLGSGWVWLVLNRKERKLSILHTRNAICPLAFGDIPIISLDLWEHAYYIDYKDDRRTYVTNFMDHLISWHTVTLRMMRAEAFVNLGEPNIPVA